MSLVSEALRKARRHSDAAGSGGPGAALPPTLVLPPRRHRPGLAAGTVLAVAAAAALAGAAGVWVLVGRQHREPPAGQVAAAPPVVPTAGAPAAVPTAAPPPTAVAAGPAPAVPADSGGSGPASTPSPEPPQPAAAAEPRQHGESGAVAAAAAAPREGSYLIDADLGYARLHLDYLVFRPGSPFGRVNGQDVVTGTTVSGFVVEEITVDHIKLADKRHTVILRVR